MCPSVAPVLLVKVREFVLSQKRSYWRVCVCICACVIILKFLSCSSLMSLRSHAVRGLATSKTVLSGLSFGMWTLAVSALGACMCGIVCGVKVEQDAFVPAICHKHQVVAGVVVQRVEHCTLRSVGCRFKSYSGQCCVTTLGKLFTPMCLCHQAV